MKITHCEININGCRCFDILSFLALACDWVDSSITKWSTPNLFTRFFCLIQIKMTHLSKKCTNFFFPLTLFYFIINFFSSSTCLLFCFFLKKGIVLKKFFLLVLNMKYNVHSTLKNCNVNLVFSIVSCCLRSKRHLILPLGELLNLAKTSSKCLHVIILVKF